MSKLIPIALLAAVALLLTAPAGAATAAAPKLGFYNCYARGYPIVYQGTVQLNAGGRYAWGYLDTANRRLKSARSGSYRGSGSRITWSGGPLGRLYGVVKAPTKFEVWASGERFASYTCYWKF